MTLSPNVTYVGRDLRMNRALLAHKVKRKPYQGTAIFFLASSGHSYLDNKFEIVFLSFGLMASFSYSSQATIFFFFL
jgi:hypothetical protein